MVGKIKPVARIPASKLSKKRLLAFKVISLLVPILILFLLEIVLRLFHYGYDPALFITYPGDKDYLILNPDASKKYFTDQAVATSGNIEPFRKEKDSNTLRIFVLGESTTIGYPYFHNGSFHRWLQYRLQRNLPDKNIEVINCSMTAVNSYTVAGFAKEVVHYQPDAVLIYTGHNEYYGALGVGSTGRIGGSPGMVNAFVSLRSIKLGQLVINCYHSIAGLFRSSKTKNGKRLMEVMVAEQQIPYGESVFNSGVEQFRSNMETVLKLFEKNKIPVFISNLVSNEKDLKPFVSLPVDSTRFPAFKPAYEIGIKAYDCGNFAEAEKYFLLAQSIFSTHAACNFYLGKLAYKRGNIAQAKPYFSRALDLDALRFRAPGRINEIIAEFCIKYKNTHYVDTKAMFEAWSPGHIMGNELILEHVHPNLFGYALLSEAFYQALKLEDIFSLAGNDELSLQQLLRIMPITAIDSLAGSYRIEALKKSWPFNEALTDTVGSADTELNTKEKKLANDVALKQLSWQEANEKLYDYYIANHELRKAAMIMEGLALEHASRKDYFEKAANVYGELNDYENAVFYFRKEFSIGPSTALARYVFVLYFKLDQPERAIPYLDYAIGNGGGPALTPIKKLGEEIIGLEQKYARDTSSIAILTDVAARYYQMGNREGCIKYIDKILRSDSGNKEALMLQQRVKNIQ